MEAAHELLADGAVEGNGVVDCWRCLGRMRLGWRLLCHGEVAVMRSSAVIQEDVQDERNI